MQRTKSLQRLLKVQEDLRRRAEAQVVRLEARAHDLADMETSIFTTLASHDPRDQALARMSGDRLRWLERDRQENDLQLQMAQDVLRSRLVQRLTCEKIECRLRAQERLVEEQKFLSEICESFYARVASFE